MTTEKIIEEIEQLQASLKEIGQEVRDEDSLDLAWRRIERWKENAVKIVSKVLSPAEGKKLEDGGPVTFSMSDVFGNFRDYSKWYQDHLTALREDVESNPSLYSEIELVPEKNENTSPLSKVEIIAKRFHRVARQLRSRHDKRPTIEVNDEYDVQDVMHALLSVHFDDIRAEEWTPSYAGKSARTDFLLKEEKIVIEIKKTRERLTDKEIGDELMIDIERYQVHPDCKTLICFVYDPEGRIGNPKGLVSDLEGRHRNDLVLKVIIEPQS